MFLGVFQLAGALTMTRMSSRRIQITVALAFVIAAGVTWIVIATGDRNGFRSSQSKLGTCQASQIVVSLGPNVKSLSQYPGANQLIPVFFKNRGPSCQVRHGGPAVLAGIGSRTGPESSWHDSFPAVMSKSVESVDIARGREREAIFEVVKSRTLGSANTEECIAKTAIWLSISGYGLPIESAQYFSRKVPLVCFATPGASQQLNTAVFWLPITG